MNFSRIILIIIILFSSIQTVYCQTTIDIRETGIIINGENINNNIIEFNMALWGIPGDIDSGFGTGDIRRQNTGIGTASYSIIDSTFVELFISEKNFSSKGKLKKNKITFSINSIVITEDLIKEIKYGSTKTDTVEQIPDLYARSCEQLSKGPYCSKWELHIGKYVLRISNEGDFWIYFIKTIPELFSSLTEIEAYESYLRKYPNPSDKDRLHYLVCETKLDYIKYIETYSNGEYTDSAKNKIVDLEYQELIKNKSLENCRNFLSNYPGSTYQQNVWAYVDTIKIKLLNEAIFNDKHTEASKYIDEGLNFDIVTECEGFSNAFPLMVSAVKENAFFVNELIEKGANINQVDRLGNTALFGAISTGNRDIVELLVSKGADIKIRNNNNISSTVWALKTNNIEIGEYLIRNSSNIDIDALTASYSYTGKENTVKIFNYLGYKSEVLSKEKTIAYSDWNEIYNAGVLVSTIWDISYYGTIPFPISFGPHKKSSGTLQFTGLSGFIKIGSLYIIGAIDLLDNDEVKIKEGSIVFYN